MKPAPWDTPRGSSGHNLRVIFPGQKPGPGAARSQESSRAHPRSRICRNSELLPIPRAIRTTNHHTAPASGSSHREMEYFLRKLRQQVSCSYLPWRALRDPPKRCRAGHRPKELWWDVSLAISRYKVSEDQCRLLPFPRGGSCLKTYSVTKITKANIRNNLLGAGQLCLAS